MTYVVSAALPSHNELDCLDGPAYVTVASNIPYNHRTKILGDNYLSKLTDFGAKTEKLSGPPNSKIIRGKTDAKKVDNKNLKIGDSGGSNMCVYDPDGIAPMAVTDATMRVGSFTVYPYIGVIGPGQVAGVDITFDPSGCETAQEKLRFIVCGSDENDSVAVGVGGGGGGGGGGFHVTGDSCYPCIITEDTSSIFEEIEVISSLASSTVTVTGMRAGMGSRTGMGTGTEIGSEDDEKHSRVPVGKVIFAEKENIMMWGAVMCDSGDTRGVAQRVRITNPTKIDTKVKFRILTTEEAAEGTSSTLNVKIAGKEKDNKTLKKEAKSSKVTVIPVAVESAFTVQPEVWDIPPHEHRYVTVYFNPVEIKNYRAVFTADVADCSTLTATSTSTSTSTAVLKRKASAGSGTSLIFDIGGSGTMPCISIEKPTQRQSDGSLLLDFQKVHVDRICCRRISIKNRGVMSATCLFEMTGSDDFKFSGKNASLTLEPGQQEDLTVSYCPKSVGDSKDVQTASVRVTVLNNHFDFYLLKLIGSAYECDAIIDIDTDTDTVTDIHALTVHNSNSNSNSYSNSYSYSNVRGNSREKKGSDLNYDKSHEHFTFPEINLSESPGCVSSTTRTLTLRSRSSHTLKYEFSLPDGKPCTYQFVVLIL